MDIKKIIAVDLDEVLAETFDAMLKKYDYKLNGVKIKKSDIHNYNLWENKKLKLNKKKSFWIFAKFLIGAGLWHKVDCVKGAKKKLLELKNKGYKFHVVTARNSIFRFTTGVWLYKNYKNIFDTVEFANFFTRFSTKKSKICKRLGANIIVEDNLENAIDCAKEGIKVYLLDKSWNQDYDKKKHKGIIKVKSWDEINI